MTKQLPTKEYLESLFYYQDSDGTLRRLVSVKGGVGNRNVGDEAGTFHKSSGYKYVKIDGNRFAVHRVIYKLVHDVEDTGLVIDHIDGNKTNNRVSNLQLVTHQVNCQKQKVKVTNTSGVTGVFFNKLRGTWNASIRRNGKKLHLGAFKEFDNAVQARRLAEITYVGM